MPANASVTVRPAVPQDAETIIRMMDALGVVTQDPPTGLTPDDILRDGFGPEPWFIAFIAEHAGEPVGLAVAQRAYATDLGFRGLYVTELFVEDQARSKGAGRALMRAVTAHCKALGGSWVGWDVWVENKPAYAFYEALGAQHRDEVSLMILKGKAFEALLLEGC